MGSIWTAGADYEDVWEYFKDASSWGQPENN